MGDLIMSNRECDRADVMARIKHKKMSQIQAATLLELGVRQVKRLYKAYKDQGIRGLVSQHRGKRGNHRLSDQVKEAAIRIIRELYWDFGPTFACEKLVQKHHLNVSVSSIRLLMVENNLWIPKRSKKPVIHQMRERRGQCGELVQIDGSPHDWFEERAPKCCLLVAIDDATSRLMQLLFVEVENLDGYFEMTRRYILEHGRPATFYSDRHQIFRSNRTSGSTGLTQFGRALKELDIHLICAWSPQAKGRVERVNGVLQDRLVKELRLRGISNIEEANSYLPQYIEEHNSRFAVPSKSPHDAHRTLNDGQDLTRILCRKDQRKLSKDLILQYDNVFYQIVGDRYQHRLQHATVTVLKTMNEEVVIEHEGRTLQYVEYYRQEFKAEVVESKMINPMFERWKDKKARKPRADHPWRRINPVVFKENSL